MSNIRDQTKSILKYSVNLSEDELLDLLVILEADKSDEAYYLYDIFYNVWTE